MSRQTVGTADFQHDDWEGTVTLDNAPGKDLYGLLDIDHDLYWLLGFGLWRGEGLCLADAYVVERVQVSEFEELEGFVTDQGEIPVIRMRREVRNLESVLGLFKGFAMVAFARHQVSGPGRSLAVESALVWNEDAAQWDQDET